LDSACALEIPKEIPINKQEIEDCCKIVERLVFIKSWVSKQLEALFLLTEDNLCNDFTTD